MLDALVWLFQNIGLAFYNFFYALSHPQLWLDWSDKEAIMRFVYYGGSVEFFFVVFTIFLIVTAIGLWRNAFMWGCVRGLEGFANTIGRFFAWAGLLMVIQQIVIVFVQRIFARPDIVFGFGIPLQKDISWWAEELKFYNALVVCLCCTYTFVQGGHVRVDLVYSAVKFRTKRVIDMIGCLIFMMPVAVLVWLYGWYFLWRHLITPNPSASDTLERLMMKARAVRWNVETIGFSPNGFNGYFLFRSFWWPLRAWCSCRPLPSSIARFWSGKRDRPVSRNTSTKTVLARAKKPLKARIKGAGQTCFSD